jgi:hypothetical protein
MRFKGNFFKHADPIFFDEGPRSFFEYQHNNIHIILIGHFHSSISGKHAMPQYFKGAFIDVFSQWMQDCSLAQKRALVIAEYPEQTDTEEMQLTEFMDCVMRVKMPVGFNIVKSDTRIIEDAFNDFGNFLYYIDAICKEITNSKEPTDFKTISHKSLLHEKPVINAIKEASSAIHKKMYLQDMETHLQKQHVLLENILKISLKKYPEIAPLITEYCDSFQSICLQELNELTEWCKEKTIQDESLDRICIHMIEECENFSLIDKWINLISADMTFSLDAILLYQLWEKTKTTNPVDYIFLIAGQAHIETLSKLLDAFFTKLRAFSVLEDKDSSIQPMQLENLLTECLPKRPDKSCCIQ